MTVTMAGVCAARSAVLVEVETDCSICDSSENSSSSLPPLGGEVAVSCARAAVVAPATKTHSAVAAGLRMMVDPVASDDLGHRPRQRLHVGGGGFDLLDAVRGLIGDAIDLARRLPDLLHAHRLLSRRRCDLHRCRR